MELEKRSVPRLSLAAITGMGAAALGLLMAIGGLALGIAILSTQQPWLQVVTACVLVTSGVVNLRSSNGIRHERPRALLQSAVVSTALMVYLGAGLGDFGEPFWAHSAYLVLLLTLSYRSGMRERIAAQQHQRLA